MMRMLKISVLMLFCFCQFLFSQVTFVNVQKEIGEQFRVYPNATAWGDIDNDGDLDAYLTMGSKYGNDLMINDLSNSGIFLWADSTMAHAAKSSGPRCGLLADIENDGDLDIFTIGQDYQNWLIINKLAETDSLWFEDISEQTGVIHLEEAYYNATMADYNNDGLLDIFVCGLTSYAWTPSLLFKNTSTQEGVSFEEVAYDVGIYSLLGVDMVGASWADYDDDGDQDVIIIPTMDNPVFLYRNEGNDTFTEVTADAGLGNSFGESRSALWADFDNDCDLDLFIGRRPNENYPNADRCQFFSNDGDGTFTEVINARITGKVFYGSAAGDYDNDGDIDLHLLNSEGDDYMLRNDGNFVFTDVAAAVGLTKVESAGGWGLIDIDDRGGQTWADWDADGDLDLLLPGGNGSQISYLMQNDGGNSNNWLEIKLTGVTSNRSAVGTRVIVRSGDLRQIREVCMGSGYLAGPTTDVHVGLAQQSTVDSIIIKWPSGTIDELVNVSANQILSITEGSSPSGVASDKPAIASDFTLYQNYPNPFNPQTRISYSLTQPSQVKLEVYAITGQCISVLKDGYQQAGTHYVDFDAQNLPAGLYLYQIKAGNVKQQKKMLLIK